MEDVQIALEVMGPVELKQLRIALRNSIENTAANAKINPRATNSTEVVEALATLKSLNTRAVATKLRMVLGEVGFEKMSQQIANTSDAMLMEATVVAGSRTAIRQLVQKRFEEIIGPSVGEQIGQKGLIGAVTSPAVDAAVSGGSQASRISAAQEQLAPVLSRRMTPEDLMQQALAMENAAPGIARAREAGEARRSLVTGGILGGTIAQQPAGREAPFPGLSLLGPR